MRTIGLALVCLACGGSVHDDPSANAGGAPGGSTGNGGSAGNGGATATCTLTDGHFFAQLSTSSSAIDPPPVCTTSEWAVKEWSGTGIVTSSSNNALEIDQCSPAADCVPMPTKISFGAPSLMLTIPTGAIVRVEYTVSSTWYACAQLIAIFNEPSWDGFENPVSSSPDLYLAAADGTFGTLDDVPFSITPIPLGCQPASSGCGGTQYPPDLYALSFVNLLAATTVPMGETKPIGMGLTARNLRSSVSGACDDYWDWGYWASRQ